MARGSLSLAPDAHYFHLADHMKFTTTLLSYRQSIKRKLKIPVSQNNGEWPDDYLDEVINEARRAFWDKARYRAKYSAAYFNAINGTADYDLTTKNIEDIDLVRYNNGTAKYVLDFVALETFLNLTRTVQSGDPEAWTLVDNDLKLYPTPGANVTNGVEVWGMKELTELDEDADIDTDIETRFKPLIVRYALGLAWEEAEQMDVANRHYAIFEKRYDEVAFAINSMTTGQNVPDGVVYPEDETNERRFNRPIG